jgi:hypothetical protein
MSTTVTIEQQELQTLPAGQEQSFEPVAAVPIARVKQKWNEPAINRWRILMTFVSFAIVGASDGVYGVGVK